ncbi:hypothetical protein NDU88_006674 [Pleurodeles waltl]|uniref:Uncharacterized protein n=1 Tax=Pleurodeles waltl TaxID=8319 RepID=A0AAV7TXT8_PLEWA|nr:hypothetical protein NDU88_006674 [Pleurodeles waltl]
MTRSGRGKAANGVRWTARELRNNQPDLIPSCLICMPPGIDQRHPAAPRQLGPLTRNAAEVSGVGTATGALSTRQPKMAQAPLNREATRDKDVETHDSRMGAVL